MSGINPLDLENFNREEDEDIEEQKRREAELQDLLATGFKDFNYDNESTMNSSSTSIETTNYNKSVSATQPSKGQKLPSHDGDHLEIKYKNPDADQYEQLKVLYEIRQREAKHLKEDLTHLQNEKAKEIATVKSQMILMEGEIHQLKLSNSNLESLLEQKTTSLRQQQEDILAKEQELKTLKKRLAEMNLVVGSYESRITELELKLADSNPFSGGDRLDNAKQIQKNHEDQYNKQEHLIQEQSIKLESLQKENVKLKEELAKATAEDKKREEENLYALMTLAKKYQQSQEQCKNLFDLGEAIKQESDHFRERLRQIESNETDVLNDSFTQSSLDKDSLVRQLEKLKRLLYDQTVEMNTLQNKLKSYNFDYTELFHYRKVLSEMSTSEIQTCSNADHSDLILFLRKQLQSYEQAVEDRNQQIISLNSLNKDLHERIEEMIAQTRNDIQNISQRYKLPQLETMSNELRIAEQTISELREQLKHQDDPNIQQHLHELKQENAQLKRELQLVTSNFQSELSTLHEDLGESKNLLQKLQNLLDSSQNSQMELEKEKASLASELEETKLNLRNLTQYLSQCQQSTLSDLKMLLKKMKEFYNKNTDSSHLKEHLTSWIAVLEKLKKFISGFSTNGDQNIEHSFQEEVNVTQEDTLTYRLEHLTQELKQANNLISELNGKHRLLLSEADSNSGLICELKAKIQELNEQLQQVDVDESVKVNNTSQKQIYFAELDETATTVIDGKKAERTEETQTDAVNLGEKIRKEMEETFKKLLKKKSDYFEKEREKWQQQESGYRQNLIKVLQECGTQIKKLETENNSLIAYNRQLRAEFQSYKNSVQNKENLLFKTTTKQIATNQKWSNLIQSCSMNLTNLDKQHRLRIENMKKKIAITEHEVKLLEDLHQDKVKTFKRIYKTMP